MERRQCGEVHIAILLRSITIQTSSMASSPQSNQATITSPTRTTVEWRHSGRSDDGLRYADRDGHCDCEASRSIVDAFH